MKYMLITLAAMAGAAFMSGNIAEGRQAHESARNEVKSEKIINSRVQPDSVTIPAEKNLISDDELFERTVSVVKEYESLHKAKHWPYVGYGHKAKAGDGFTKGTELSERAADKLLREDLRMYLSMYSEYGRDAYLLAALAYNCGNGRVDKSPVLAKIKSGDRDGIREAYLSHSRSGGRFRQQLRDRREAELELLFQP